MTQGIFKVGYNSSAKTGHHKLYQPNSKGVDKWGMMAKSFLFLWLFMPGT